MIDVTNQINELIKKASESKEGADAMHFAQAALSAAHVVQILSQVKSNQK